MTSLVWILSKSSPARLIRPAVFFLSLILLAPVWLGAQVATSAGASFLCSTSSGGIFPGDTANILGELKGNNVVIQPSAIDFKWSGFNVIGDGDKAIFTAPE